MVMPTVETTAETETYGRFVIKPLDPGFGLTLGNALRRVLLSALPGAAVTWIKVDGVQHEFTAVPHMKEDMIDFLLNIKALRIRPLSDRPGIITLDVSGQRDVTAADIVTSADFEIVNKHLHLATLDSPQARLTVELNVEHGTGYRPSPSATDQRDRRMHHELGIGTIAVDAIFTPVRKVNYVIETTRIGEDNYDGLILEVWTDATITPSNAVGKAATILVEHFATVADVGKLAAARLSDKQPLSAIAMPQKQYDTPIEDLDLSVRTYNSLKRAGITKVGQIVEMSEDDLLNVRNFGQKSLDELRERLEVRGFLVGRERTGSSVAVADPEPDDDD